MGKGLRAKGKGRRVKGKLFYPMLLVLCPMLYALCTSCYAQSISSAELINNAKQYDGKIVTYKGEVIGDIMIRGDYVWLHVNDGIIAIGIWASKTLTQDISYTGDYHRKGDIVEVSGTFHRSCLEHGGDLDIHAQAINKITHGTPVIRSINKKKVCIGISSLIIVLLFYALKRLFRR